MNPIKTIIQLKAQYVKAKAQYEIGKSIMTDAQFDKLEDQIRKLDPKWAELRKTGVAVKSKKMKTELERKMPSLDKRYPDAIDKWLDGEDKVAMDKEDGSSLLLGLKGGSYTKLATRGDGNIGGDISFLLPYLNIPKVLKYKAEFWMRCEAVMADAVFDKHYKDKYDNPRNLVAGILNRTMTGEPTAEEKLALKRTDIIVLGVFDTPLVEGLEAAKRMGFTVVPYTVIASPTVDGLTTMLARRRRASPYAMDGLVLANPGFQYFYKTNDKPKGIIAFKINSEDDAVEAKVVKIIYQVTSHSRIVPKVEIVPQRIGGVTVTHATVHNAQWMLDRKIGPGAIIKIVRSGGVIPKIVGVVKAGKLQLPTISHKLDGKHFVVKEATSGTKDRITVLNIHKFMTVMGIDLLGTKTITQMLPTFPNVEAYLLAWHNNGGFNGLAPRLVKAGLGLKTATNIEAEFKKALGSAVPLKRLMVASRCYPIGIGERKLSQLEAGGISMRNVVQRIEKKQPDQLANAVASTFGFDDKTAKAIVDGTTKFLPRYNFFRQLLKLDGSLPLKKVKKVDKPQRLNGQFVSWTGYRDEEQEEQAEEAGADVGSFGSRTTILLYKEGGKASTKVDKAREKGIKVLTWPQLVKEFKL